MRAHGTLPSSAQGRSRCARHGLKNEGMLEVFHSNECVLYVHYASERVRIFFSWSRFSCYANKFSFKLCHGKV